MDYSLSRTGAVVNLLVQREGKRLAFVADLERSATLGRYLKAARQPIPTTSTFNRALGFITVRQPLSRQRVSFVCKLPVNKELVWKTASSA
jgi:hypothetical protein